VEWKTAKKRKLSQMKPFRQGTLEAIAEIIDPKAPGCP